MSSTTGNVCFHLLRDIWFIFSSFVFVFSTIIVSVQFAEEMEEYASISWGEIVEREITRYRKPGEFAERHEKLSSPSRKR